MGTMTHDSTTDRDPLAMSVAEIDLEVAALTNSLDVRVNDMDLAVGLEGRRQALLSARRLAVVRERARARQQQADEAREAHVRFAALEAELPPRLREQAQALDAWITAGARLVADYRGTLRQLADVQDVLSPPTPGREFHLHGFFDRLAVDQSLSEGLARAGVLAHVLPAQARDPANTVEAHVVHRVKRFLDEARQRLPAAPSSEDAPAPVNN